MPRQARPVVRRPDPPAEPVAKRYKVTGPLRVYETAPGGYFTAALPVAQERTLLDAGHIELAPLPEPPAPAPLVPRPPVVRAPIPAERPAVAKRKGK